MADILKTGVRFDGRPFVNLPNGILNVFTSFEELGAVAAALHNLLVTNGYAPNFGLPAPPVVSLTLGEPVVTLTVTDDLTGYKSTTELDSYDLSVLFDDIERAGDAQFGERDEDSDDEDAAILAFDIEDVTDLSSDEEELIPVANIPGILAGFPGAIIISHID